MALLFIAFGYLCCYPAVAHWENLLQALWSFFLLHYFQLG